MSTYSSVNEKRSKNWLVNAVRYHWLKKFKGDRDANLWLFSAWEGQKYADNTKYLFEYMLKNHLEIKCIWQTRNQDVYQQLRREEKPVQMIGTEEAKKAQKEAGVVFYTNGLDDFGDFPLIYGAVIISLWHGVGFKKIYRELQIYPNKLRKVYGTVKWKFFSWVKRDITVVTSNQSKSDFIRWFDLEPKDRIIITGQPRNDAFLNEGLISKALKNSDIEERVHGKRIILLMPTFRKNTDILINQLNDLWKSKAFERVLTNNNAVLLTKLHYLNQGNLKSTGCKILLNDSDVLDTQEMLCCSDILITDYSSCAIDFALQKKPILFYFPDWEEYGANACMREGTRDICSINCAETTEELVNKIEETLQAPQRGLLQSEKLNQIYDGTSVAPGEYSENVYQKIIEILDL